MDLTIRDAKLQDAEFILSGIRDIFKIEKCVFSDRIYSEMKKSVKEAIKNRQARVAVEGNKPVGFSCFKIGDMTPFGLDYGRWSGRYCWISWVYVVKGYRNQGIGSLLYEDIARICKRKKIREIMLDVFTVNKKSASFHERIGFKPFLSIFTRSVK